MNRVLTLLVHEFLGQLQHNVTNILTFCFFYEVNQPNIGSSFPAHVEDFHDILFSVFSPLISKFEMCYNVSFYKSSRNTKPEHSRRGREEEEEEEEEEEVDPWDFES